MKDPAAALPTVRLTPRGSTRLATRHCWIYRSDIAKTGRARAGDLVRVLDHQGNRRGHALYSDRSEITLRMVDLEGETWDEGFWARRLDRALARRREWNPERDCERLVHGEGDGLPSLVVDRYADVVSLQTLSQGMERLKPLWVQLLQERLRPRSIIERNEARVRELEGLPLVSGVLAGEDPGAVEIHQGPARLQVEPLAGQKTGAFLDQYDNREAAARWARGAVLDCFCGEGPFTVRVALEDRVESVVGVESSAEAIERARANAERNGVDIEWICDNAFDVLRGLVGQKRSFDSVILDPPAFAKNRASVEGALRGYKEINLRALKLLRPGGVLVTCTCSHHVREADFLQIIAAAAADAGRDVTLMEKRTQAADHPIRLAVPETYYLKCLILRVD